MNQATLFGLAVDTVNVLVATLGLSLTPRELDEMVEILVHALTQAQTQERYPEALG